MAVELPRRWRWAIGGVGAFAGDSGYTAAMPAPVGGDHDFSCAKVRHELGVLRLLATVGESGAVREWVAGSGKTLEDFVRAVREQQQVLRAREQAAIASAAATGARAGSR